MNKIKLIYDVVQRMREKEVINGTLAVEGKKDDEQFLSVKNQFQKNVLTGEVKANLSVEFEADGKKVKNESSVEFNPEGRPDSMPAHFCRHMHHHHAHHGGMPPHSFKDKLNRLAFALKILDNMQVEEQGDKILLTVNLDELPEELKKGLHGKMHPEMAEHHHKHPFPFKEFMMMEKNNITLLLQLNSNKDVERITLQAGGQQKDEQNNMHALSFTGELQFAL